MNTNSLGMIETKGLIGAIEAMCSWWARNR